MQYISTLHIKYEIENQPEFIHTYKVFEQKALEKEYFMYCSPNKFFIHRKGQTVGDSPLFETDDFGAMMQFIERTQR